MRIRARGGPRALPVLAAVLTLALGVALAVAPRSLQAAEGTATERWYEILRDGDKRHARVVWAPSTWQGKPTIHDTTTITTQSVRDMLGMKDEFSSTTTIDLERAEDGTLWWQKTVVREAKRTLVAELTWTGNGYDHVERLGEESKNTRIDLDRPVMTDVEAFLAQRARAGELKPGLELKLRGLDVQAREARETDVKVLASETIEGEAGPIATSKVEERDPRSGSANLLWMDADGAFVQGKFEGGVVYRRTTREKAEEAPVHPAEQSITTPSSPALERIFSADRVLLDLHLRGDADRPLPKFPDSPWSRVLSTSGDDAKGWVLRIELRKYDGEAVRGSLPVDAKSFERDLESTVLMPLGNERLRTKAKDIVGEEKDLRAAAHRIARWVYEKLEKHSPEVNQADALQILEECRGDCSEHALLFVALCRAAGIPARMCSGYVSVGSAWGAHAWAEIWTGQWISADPTTGEVGGGARYLFFGYSDRSDSFPGVVSSRAGGRMRFVLRRVEEGDDAYDLGDEETYYLSTPKDGRYVHVLAGLELRGVPEDWEVHLSGDGDAHVRGPGVQADLRAFADQGQTLDDAPAGRRTTFAGAPALVLKVGQMRRYMVHSRRRLVQVVLRAESDDGFALLEKVLAPTFAPRPTKP